MTPREKVSRMVASALSADGFDLVSAHKIYDQIWTPQGGERGLDIARWDVTINCEKEGRRIPLHVHSWSTLTQLSKQKSLKLVPHSVREIEVM